MLYAKNLPNWERAVRLTAAIGLALCAYVYRENAAGIVFAVIAVTTALTALVGFCPMCALAGRRLAARNERTP